MDPRSDLDRNPAAKESVRAYQPAPVLRPEHSESTFTRLVEQQTAKIPSDYFLFAALCTMGGSLFWELKGRPRESHFVGMWVAPLLIMGVYNKLVKLLGTR